MRTKEKGIVGRTHAYKNAHYFDPAKDDIQSVRVITSL